METSVSKIARDAYRLVLGDREAVLDGEALKNLVLQITRALLPAAPQAAPAAGSPEETRAFLARLQAADDLGLQALVRLGGRDDVVALLKAAERAPPLLERFHRNMSAKARKMFAEDVDYMFRDRAPDAIVDAAVSRLKLTVEELERRGALRFGS
jgi:flagellar motor switch protein FliG